MQTILNKKKASTPKALNALFIRLTTLYHTIRKGSIMAKRKAMKRSKDKKVYTSTANNVKKINVTPKISRGGICL